MSKAVSIRKRKKRPTIFSKNKETIVMPIDNSIYFFGISLPNHACVDKCK